MWAIIIRVGVGYGFGRVIRGRGQPSGPERIRVGIQQLGLTYVKLGQFLAMRFDILPVEYCRELEKLFDDVPPEDFAAIRVVVESELGGSIDDLFARFCAEPTAAGSIAQVHEAWSSAGDHLAVKVQRPGIGQIFESDMRNLRRIAWVVDAVGALNALSAREIADEFARWTQREFDFLGEAETAHRVRSDALPYEVAPAIVWELTSRRVLTMEYIDGLNLNAIIKLVESGGWDSVRRYLPDLDIDLLIHRAAFASLRQIFVAGFFHGDPHPGNLIIMENNNVAFIDFGIFGELTDYHRQLLLGFIENLSLGLIDASFRNYAALSDPTDDSDVDEFAEQGTEILTRWYESALDPAVPMADRHFGKYAGQMTEAVRKNGLRLSMDTLLFWRTLHTLNATALRVVPEFDLLAELRQFFNEMRVGPATRLQTVLHDPGWRDGVVALGSRVTSGAAARIGTSTGAALMVTSGQASVDRRGKDLAALQLSAALVLLSLVTLASALHLAAAIRLAAVVAAAVIIVRLGLLVLGLSTSRAASPDPRRSLVRPTRPGAPAVSTSSRGRT